MSNSFFYIYLWKISTYFLNLPVLLFVMEDFFKLALVNRKMERIFIKKKQSTKTSVMRSYP